VRKGKAPKGSIYYHFPLGKEQIASEAISPITRAFSGQSGKSLAEKRAAAEDIR
jgi:TetR/AcrR family transcriptional repressor of lmrAB and yxaGH operons